MSRKRSKTGRALDRIKALEAKLAEHDKDASAYAQVWIDRWLMDGNHLAEVSDDAIETELQRRWGCNHARFDGRWRPDAPISASTYDHWLNAPAASSPRMTAESLARSFAAPRRPMDDSLVHGRQGIGAEPAPYLEVGGGFSLVHSLVGDGGNSIMINGTRFSVVPPGRGVTYVNGALPAVAPRRPGKRNASWAAFRDKLNGVP